MLDVSLTQLQNLIAELSEGGYFEAQTRPGNGVELKIEMGEQQYQKPWTTEPALERLVGRIYHEGWLGSIHPLN